MTDATRAALAYAETGLFPVPIPHGRKAPVLKGWQDLRLTAENVERYFNGDPQNVGVNLSASGLADVDLDSPEAVALAPLLLPETRTFGRHSKRRSHFLYWVLEPVRTERFQVATPHGPDTIVEVRCETRKGTPCQTVFPPSTHPSGEAVAWEGPKGHHFAEIDGDDLRRRVRCLAGVAVLVRLYPVASGGRHDAAGALASVLARSEVADFAPVPALVSAIAIAAGDDDPDDRATYAADTVAALERGEAVTGAPRLAELLCRSDADRAMLRKALDWLGFTGRPGDPVPPRADVPPSGASVLDIRTGAEWMEAAAALPRPRPLWGPLWFEGETTILFSETNAGKSVAAVQVADAIARGRDAFGLACEAEPQTVLYLDFELSPKQYERRYSRDFADPYVFAPGFHRAELDPDALADEDAFDVAVRDAIEAAVVAHGYRVVIVDNLTFIGRQSQEARDALPLMRALHRIKLKHGLSMLVLGHTPKRDGTRPLTLNDLGGSRHLANFADAVVGLGKSAREPDVRYLKQLKVRSAELEYHAEHVLTLRLEKPGNFLGFQALDLGPESAHLREMGDEERAQRDAAIIDLRSAGLSYREVGDRLGISHMAAKRAVDRAGGADAVTPVTPSQTVTPVTRRGDGIPFEPSVPYLTPGTVVGTPRGPGTVTAAPEDGRVSVDVDGLPVSFPLDAVTPTDAPF